MMRDYLPIGARILDFGCGPCDKTALYQRLGYECYACDDLNDDWHKEGNNAEIIKRFAEREGIHFFQTSNGTLPYDEEFFDGILLVDVVEHLHDSPRSVLNVLIAKLKPEGLVFMGMPNSVNIRKRISVVLGRTNYPSLGSFYFSKEPWRGHVREYTLNETKQLLRYHNLDVVYGKGVNIFAHKRLRNRFLKLSYLLATRIFTSLSEGILVIGRKPEAWEPTAYSQQLELQHTKRPVIKPIETSEHEDDEKPAEGTVNAQEDTEVVERQLRELGYL
jgi:SAM-dependent methyltransferase